MAAAIRTIEMPMSGLGTDARPWSCASGSASHAIAATSTGYPTHHVMGEFAGQAVKQDAIRLLTDATVRPTGSPGGSTG